MIIADLDGYSSSDIAALCKEVAMGPLLDHQPHDLAKLKRDDIWQIMGKDFATAMKKIKPSYSKSKC